MEGVSLSSTDAPAKDRLLVTICTYNERENIVGLVSAIRQAVPAADVLVVDDNSPDGTADAVRQLQATDAHIKLLSRADKNGLGAATIAAFEYGLTHHYDLLLNLDADFSHPPERIPELLAAMDRADLVIGSRYVAGGSISGWGPTRHIMSRVINSYARLMLGIRSRDCSGAFRCVRLSMLSDLDFNAFVSKGYAFQEEFLYRCQRLGCVLAEVPIAFVDRRAGSSKINLREIVAAVRDIATLGLHRLRGKSVVKPQYALGTPNPR